MTTTALRDSAGKVIGGCDSIPFDVFGRRPYQPKARRRVADQTIIIEPDAPTRTLADIIPGYKRLR